MRQEKASRWLPRNDSRLEEVIRLLKIHFEVPCRKSNRSALQVLVLTILSQNTTDGSALKAYKSLLKKFSPPGLQVCEDELPRDKNGEIDSVRIRMAMAADSMPEPDWEMIDRSERAEVAEAISVCGLQEAKSRTIKNILSWLREQEAGYQLDNLIDSKNALKTTELLTKIKGIGIKTATVTLIEARGADLCPVDTHVHRVCQRLRLVAKNSGRKKTFFLLNELIPAGEGYALHHNLLSFGRTICTARNPYCDKCFFQRLCYDYRCVRNEENLTLKTV